MRTFQTKLRLAVLNPILYFSMFAALYFAQGLPSGLIAHALPSVLRDQGVSLSLIGLLKLLALPWLFKFLWAPFVDRPSADLTRSRCRWIIAMQCCTALTLLGLAWALSVGDPHGFVLPLLLILLINTFCATQDIATDSLAVSWSKKSDLGIINSLQVSGYKVGMIAGGSGCLLLLGFMSWQSILVLISLTLVLLLLPLLKFKNNRDVASFELKADTDDTGKLSGLFAGEAVAQDSSESPKTKVSFNYIYQTYQQFFSQKNLALLVVGFTDL